MRMSSAVRMSGYFMPTLRDNPTDAEIVSHRLMLRAGMIRQESAGIYSWLPLGLRVLRKIEQIVREEQDAIAANEIMMPTIQSADLWRRSGRYDDYGKEMLRITDRHERDMLFGPTNEEMITDIFAEHARSYKDVPAMLYQIQWKFRDEIRPRFGVMRGREFFMKDGYSFDLSEDAAQISYYKQFVAYLKTYARLGMRVIPMKADTGPIGGDMSHEFIILADTGESQVFCHADLLGMNFANDEIDMRDPVAVKSVVDRITSYYATTEELYDEKDFHEKVPRDKRISTRGIEVGHIFFFGTKYSEAFGCFITDAEGQTLPVQMGSYGIGISRLVGGIIEACHDDRGIIWPRSVAPFDVGLINLRVGDVACDALCEELFTNLCDAGLEVLYDERDERAGVKFADMDLIGLPQQLIIGPKGIKFGTVELKDRSSGERRELSVEEAMAALLS